ncbi:MAG: hypothetical protein J6X39_02820, partial [Bacteroidales bacterium]|nr:hypothetical protein [Bacteroidales bacterium]
MLPLFECFINKETIEDTKKLQLSKYFPLGLFALDGKALDSYNLVACVRGRGGAGRVAQAVADA